MAIKYIDIGGIKIDIQYISITKNENCFGQYHPGSSKITIARELSPQQKKTTLIHEIFEAINHIYRIHLKHEQIEKLEIAFSQTRLLKL